MDFTFYSLEATRKRFTKLIESLSAEQLNAVPEGFKNNIAWNFGHILATQQILCYKNSNCKPRVDDWLLNKFKKGTAPDKAITANEIWDIRGILVETSKHLESDFKNGVFKNYQTYQTSFGVELKTIEDAIQFNVVHEGLHLGYSMSMKKLIS